jgi:hypothetical protein
MRSFTDINTKGGRTFSENKMSDAIREQVTALINLSEFVIFQIAKRNVSG